MSWKSRLMSPPHLGIFFAKKISSAFSRNWRIQSGSSFISEIWVTISASSPLRARKTGLDSVRKSYLLISPIGSAESVGLSVSVAIIGVFLLCLCDRSRGRFFFQHLSVRFVRVGIRAADAVVALGVQFVGQLDA